MPPTRRRTPARAITNSSTPYNKRPSQTPHLAETSEEPEESFSPLSTTRLSSLIDTYADGDATYDFTALDSSTLIVSGWSKSEQYLFDRIRRRARFPMFPNEWSLDFVGLPKALFVEGEEVALFTPLRGSTRACTMMERLLGLGSQIRGRLDRGRSAHKVLVAGMKKYFDWCFWDCDLDPKQPPTLFAFAQATDINHLNASIQKRLFRAAREAKSYYESRLSNESFLEVSATDVQLPPPPTVFGIAVYEFTVSIMTLNSDAIDLDDKEAASEMVKTHLVCDFSNQGMDVWNAIAVALAAVSLKEEVMEWKVYREARAERDGREGSVVGYSRGRDDGDE